MMLKRLLFGDVVEIQEAVTDKLKKVQKRGIFGSFSENVDRAKACIYANGACFELKKGIFLPHVSSIFKNQS